MRGTIMVQSIVFFASEAKAIEMAELNGGAAEGFAAVEAKGRPGKYVVEVRDTDDGLLLGYL
jgi:hypothetical protein